MAKTEFVADWQACTRCKPTFFSVGRKRDLHLDGSVDQTTIHIVKTMYGIEAVRVA